MASDGQALTGLWFDGQKYFPEGLAEEHGGADLQIFKDADRWLDIYFSGRDPGYTPQLRTDATEFRMAVWEILLSIPYGKTMTYGEVAVAAAERTGRDRMSAQAAGGAVSHNPVSLIIPCHRVIGRDGSLTGYAGGTDRKSRLLELERAGSTRGHGCE